ncbi:MAG: Omp28 family outer membrane lipoprotein [Bacteroidales bacterium]|nr:Omp28 family outer membrane lipoprotein [Bacteroidales bacterium]
MLLLLSYSCDTIDTDDRFIEMEKPEIKNTVLLEDFTGVNCSNCPAAHKYAEDAKKAHGAKLVIVSIHAGPFSSSSFQTEAGKKYQEHFYPANNSYPAGMVSRVKWDKGFVETNSSLWSTLINERFIQNYSMNIELELSVNYSEEDNSFTVESIITPLSKPTDIKLQLWITESNIESPQKDGSNIIPNYIHNHVLRDAVNGIWGEDISEIGEIGVPFSMTSISYSLEGKNWKSENLNIVGFIFDKNTEAVLYVTEIPLINKEY